jgi:hypothetical protein
MGTDDLRTIWVVWREYDQPDLLVAYDGANAAAAAKAMVAMIMKSAGSGCQVKATPVIMWPLIPVGERNKCDDLGMFSTRNEALEKAADLFVHHAIGS